MALTYASIADVKRYLRVNSKVLVGNEAASDLSETEFEAFIQDSEDKLTAVLNGRSLSAGAGRYIVIRWAAVDIYRALYPRSSVNEIPTAVLGWKNDADEVMEKVLADTGASAGAIGGWEDQV